MTSGEEMSSAKPVPYSHSLERLGPILESTGARQGWLKSELPLVLAVSGGSDSMALLWLFNSLWPGRLVVAHLNHGIRGESADMDQEFVAREAARLGLRFVTEKVSVPSMLMRGESLEDGARRVRYSFLERAHAREGAWGVALAHTSDDCVETFFMNLIRGSGARGLAGMPETRGPFFRPLLSFSKSYLVELLQYHGATWREDPTNSDDTFTRNRVRNRLIPFLREEFNPRISEAVLGVIGDMAVLRRDEERTQAALLPRLRLDVPLASYACRQDDLRKLDEVDLPRFIRGAGALLGLRTLARRRTVELCRLVSKSRRWCFQWQGDMFVLCDSRIVAWVSPAILSGCEARVPEHLLLSGESGSFDWGGWLFSWSRECATESIYGTMEAILPDCGGVEVLPLSAVEGGRAVEAPDWSRPFFPAIRSGNALWIPYWGGNRTCGALPAGIRVSVTAPATFSEKRGE